MKTQVWYSPEINMIYFVTHLPKYRRKFFIGPKILIGFDFLLEDEFELHTFFLPRYYGNAKSVLLGEL